MDSGRRNKRDNQKADWRTKFLAAVAKGSSISDAADVAGKNRTSVYREMEKDPAFYNQVAEAEKQSADLLETEARRRAVEGVTRVKTHQGGVITVPVDKDGNVVPHDSPAFERFVPLIEREYSDTLLIFLLKGRRADVFGDKVKFDGDIGLRTAADGEAAATEILDRVRGRIGAKRG